VTTGTGWLFLKSSALGLRGGARIRAFLSFPWLMAIDETWEPDRVARGIASNVPTLPRVSRNLVELLAHSYLKKLDNLFIIWCFITQRQTNPNLILPYLARFRTGFFFAKLLRAGRYGHLEVWFLLLKARIHHAGSLAPRRVDPSQKLQFHGLIGLGASCKTGGGRRTCAFLEGSR